MMRGKIAKQRRMITAGRTMSRPECRSSRSASPTQPYEVSIEQDVDDNLNFVNRLIGLIREFNQVDYIQIAENYEEACEYLEDEIPDVALLDINLPGKNGLAVLKRVKQAAPECNVIMVTNHADDYYRQQCHEMGAGHFLDKTIEFSRVPHILKELSINPSIT